MYFLEKVKTALQNPENHKALLKDPVGAQYRTMALVSLETLDMIFVNQNSQT